jgi:hypothetical protein
MATDRQAERKLLARMFGEMADAVEGIVRELDAALGAAEGEVCIECGRAWTDPDERWKRERVDLEETALYCPECHEREFGDDGEAA